MESPDTKILVVEDDASGERLDKFLSSRLPDFSRSRIQALLAQGMVTLSGKVIEDAAQKVKPAQRVTLTIPAATPTHMVAQDIALDVVYEDADLLIINKQAGLTVHPAPGHPDNTLVNALLAHCGDSLSGIGGVSRPGIVHRIDKDTSGLLVVAKHDVAHNALSAQLADRSLSRTYQAVCWGKPAPAHGTVTSNIGRSPTNRQKMAVVKTGGKPAVTHYRTLEDFGVASLVECKLESGRTHQIRVHMLHLGHPLLGDPIYGQATSSRLKSGQYKNMPAEMREALIAFDRQALHAIRMGFIHPRSGKHVEFHAPLPEDFKNLIEQLSAAK
ncbi:MAG: RluA family pseudouridine synthase [Alphaproteobacteria bacterium]|nr:RluA family pseudouridine synthase [Alphaproteobacteria bacterium]